MTRAEETFTKAFSRFFRNWAVITSLRQVADVVIPAGATALADVHTGFVEKIATEEPYKNLIVDSGSGDSSDWGIGLKAFLQVSMTATVLTDAKSAIDSASLIFAQAMLEDCALSQLEACALCKPTDWEFLLKDKKVSFTEFGKSFEVVREELINGKLAQLERESLLSKIDLLFQICKPPRDFSPIGNYSFNKERLEKIDAKRHAVVHKDGIAESLEDIDADLEYLMKTASFLMGLVNERYGLKLNSSIM